MKPSKLWRWQQSARYHHLLTLVDHRIVCRDTPLATIILNANRSIQIFASLRNATIVLGQLFQRFLHAGPLKTYKPAQCLEYDTPSPPVHSPGLKIALISNLRLAGHQGESSDLRIDHVGSR